jgi:hypothetical protein
MKTKNLLTTMALSVAICGMSFAQTESPVEKYTTDQLYVADADVMDVSGKWVGTEIQYDNTKSFIKVKFHVVLELEQEGNRVTGTSYIKDKRHNDFGHMKLRGFVMGNKLHFEEYAITKENWETENTEWCLRTGELDISDKGAMIEIAGTFDGYTADDYSQCTDYAFVTIQRAADEVPAEPTRKDMEALLANENLLLVAPSPFREQTTLSYTVDASAQVQLDIFDLSGKLVKNLVNQSQTKGEQKVIFEAENNPAGIYLARLVIGNQLYTRQIVLMK